MRKVYTLVVIILKLEDKYTMEWRLLLVFGLLSCMQLCQAALPVKCGENITNSTSGRIGVPAGFVAKHPCIVTIQRPEGTVGDFITLDLSSLNIAPKDSLIIYDGKNDSSEANRDNILANFTSETVAHIVLVGLQEEITIIFVPVDNKSSSSWTIDFNTEKCSINVKNAWSSTLTSPVYIATNDTIKLQCNYTLTSYMPDTHIAAASFTSMNLSGSSSLVVSQKLGDLVYKGDSPLMDFFAEGSTPISITLNIEGLQTFQSFSLFIEPVLAACSGPITVTNATLDLTQTFPAGSVINQGHADVCRWQIDAGDHPMLHVKVTSLQLAEDGSGDALTFRRGGSSRGSVLDELVSDVENHLVVSSENSLLITLSMRSSSGARTLNMTLITADNGGEFKGEGELIAGENSTADVVYYSLVASPGKWIEVSRIINVTHLIEDATVTFYDGSQPSGPKLTVWSAADQSVSPVTGHERMLMVLSNLAAGEFFKANFSSVEPGCNFLASAVSGEWTFDASTSLTKAQSCSWTVAPLDSEGTAVLHLESLNLRKGESLLVTAGQNLHEQTLMSYTGPHVESSPFPKVNIPAAQKFRVTFNRLAAASPFSGVAVSYRIVPQVCGGEVTDPVGRIQTPDFPNQYPLNARCDWTFGSSQESSLLFLSFAKLSLAQEHSVSVLRAGSNGTAPSRIANFGGSATNTEDLPDDIILPGISHLTTRFSSEPSPAPSYSDSVNQVGGGASVNYWILDCGGNMTSSNGSFTSPEYSSQPKKSALCVWIINVGSRKTADNSTNIVVFNISTKGKDASSLNTCLHIFDGPSQRSPNLPLSAVTSNMSRYDRLVVVFNLTHHDKMPDVRFNLTFRTMNCNSSQQCDNGVCLHRDWVCNGHDDCGDNSDERNCVIPPPTPRPAPASHQDYSGWVKAGWVPGCLFIGILLGVGLVMLTPRIIQRLRSARPGSYDRMDSAVNA